jgi:hypothetical protein
MFSIAAWTHWRKTKSATRTDCCSTRPDFGSKSAVTEALPKSHQKKIVHGKKEQVPGI